MKPLHLSLVLSSICSLSPAELIGHWEFEETSGDVVSDSTANGNNGTVSFEDGGLGENFSVWVDDPIRGRVISFDNEIFGTVVTFESETMVPVMDFENDFTWAFWALDLSSGPNHVIIGNRYMPGGGDFDPREFIKFTPTQFEYHRDGAGADNLNYNDIPNDVWHHHTVVKEGDTLTYYFDGVTVAGDPAFSGFINGVLLNPQPLYFGGDPNGGAGEFWRGYLDDVRIYDEALTAEQVLAFVPNPPPTFTQSRYFQGFTPSGSPVSFDLSTEAADPLGQPLTFEKTSGSDWLTITPAGLVSGTPADTDLGLGSITVTASDGNGSVAATVYWVVSDTEGGLPPLVGSWDFDETSGETAADSSGNGNDGFVNLADIGGLDPSGSVWANDPERGRVISFNGDGLNSSWVEFDEILVPMMTLDNNFTWAFFSKNFEEAVIGGVDNNGIIVGNRNDEFGSDFSPVEFIKFTSRLFEWYRDNALNESIDYDDLLVDVWVHNAVVKIGPFLIYYRDGVEVASTTINAGLNNPQPLFFGGNTGSGAGEFWGGYLDNVRIFDGAVTPEQIFALSQEEGGGGVTPVPDFRISNVSVAPDTLQVSITFNSVAGTTYQIGRSTTLGASASPGGWVTVEENFVATGAASEFTDTTPVPEGTESLYYRVVIPEAAPN